MRRIPFFFFLCHLVLRCEGEGCRWTEKADVGSPFDGCTATRRMMVAASGRGFSDAINFCEPLAYTWREGRCLK